MVTAEILDLPAIAIPLASAKASVAGVCPARLVPQDHRARRALPVPRAPLAFGSALTRPVIVLNSKESMNEVHKTPVVVFSRSLFLIPVHGIHSATHKKRR